jgi:hypothetical protein
VKKDGFSTNLGHKLHIAVGHLEEANSLECADSDFFFVELDATWQSRNRKSRSTSVDHEGAGAMAEYRKYAENELIGKP